MQIDPRGNRRYAAAAIGVLIIVALITSCQPAPRVVEPPSVSPVVPPVEKIAPSTAPVAPPFVPVALPPDMMTTAHQRLDDDHSERASAARAEFWRGLTPPQRQAVVWHLLVDELEPERRPKPGYLIGGADARVEALSHYLRWDGSQVDPPDCAIVLLAVLNTDSSRAKTGAFWLIRSIGFDQQGPHDLDARFVPLLDALLPLALSESPVKERLAALKCMGSFRSHVAPWAHRVATLLDDSSPEIRRRAASVLGGCGAIAVIYADKMAAQFDVNDGNQAELLAEMLDALGWTPIAAATALAKHIQGMDERNQSSLAHPIARAGPSKELADALLKLNPEQLCDDSICYWIEQSAKGDHRFVGPLFEALKRDWKIDSSNNAATCFYSQVILRAIVAAGQNDETLKDRLIATITPAAPADAKLLVGGTLTSLTGDRKYVTDALIDVLTTEGQNWATYTSHRVLDAVGEIDPARVEDFKPYHQHFAKLAAEIGQGDPTGHLMLTGDPKVSLTWARADLKKANEGRSSRLLESVSFKLGALAESLTPELVDMLGGKSAWNQAGACDAFMSIGPTTATRELSPRFKSLAGRLRPHDRTKPAMALWSCAGDVDAALAILLPLLDDQGWGTVHAAMALGEMGRDGRSALPQLRSLAAGKNPAYARVAGEAVEKIEAEIARRPTIDELWKDLAADDVYQSLRAMRQLSEGGPNTAKAVTIRLEGDGPLMLPGKRLRQHPRARQALERLEVR